METSRGQMDNSREVPGYTISEAGHYLTVPAATIRYWPRWAGTTTRH